MDNADLKEAVEIARRRGEDFIDSMNEVFAPDGLTYWDRQFRTDAEFLSWWLDMGEYPSPEFNVLYFLQQVSPKVYAEGEKRYQRAIQKTVIGAPA